MDVEIMGNEERDAIMQSAGATRMRVEGIVRSIHDVLKITPSHESFEQDIRDMQIHILKDYFHSTTRR